MSEKSTYTYELSQEEVWNNEYQDTEFFKKHTSMFEPPCHWAAYREGRKDSLKKINERDKLLKECLLFLDTDPSAYSDELSEKIKLILKESKK